MNDVKMSRGRNLLFCALAVLIALVLLFPMLWMLNTSLKTEAEIFQNPPTLYPHTLNLKSYIAQIETGDFNMFRSFLNSLIISLGSMLIAVLLAVPASYAIARYRFKGHKSVLLGFLVTQMLPVSVLLTPMFIMFRNMHLYNTWGAPILADATIGIPFNMILISTGLTSIPGELYESASIDGAGRFQQFTRITLPLMRSTIESILVLGFIYTFKVYDLVYVMTSGGPVNSTQLMSTYSYKLSFDNFLYSKGSAVANALLVILLLVGVVYVRITSRGEEAYE